MVFKEEFFAIIFLPKEKLKLYMIFYEYFISKPKGYVF